MTGWGERDEVVQSKYLNAGAAAEQAPNVSTCFSIHHKGSIMTVNFDEVLDPS